MKIPDMIGLLDNRDVMGRVFYVPVDPNKPNGKRVPAEKAVLLLFMPDCPYCKEPKKWMETARIASKGIHKLAIDVTRKNDGGLAKRVPKLFGLDQNYTVPRVYIIEHGRVKKMLKNIANFNPQRDFSSATVKKSTRRSRK